MNVLLTALTLITLAGPALAEAPRLTAAQEALLENIKTQTIELVEKQKIEAEKLRRCFAYAKLCDGEIKQKLPLIRTAIKQKSEEYRLLVGLANVASLNTSPSARLSMTLPMVHFENNFSKDRTELRLIQRLYNEDYQVMATKAALRYQHTAKNPNFNPEGYVIANELKQAQQFYSMQAFLIIHQVPFVIYLSSENVTDRDIAVALGKYVQRVQQALSDLYDIEKNPLESFLLYEPIVQSALAQDPKQKIIIEQLLVRQKHSVGLKSWIERNSPSIKLAALSTCSLVAAVLQAWPVSLACGGATAALTGKQLYEDYFKMREHFALWLTGVQSHSALKTAEARVLYSSMALFFAGQSVGNTIIAIETSLVATLSNLPTVAAARFTSLNALREGGIRFASRTIEMKGKDLGASIFAASYANVTDHDLKTSREDRLFTYKDLLMLQSAAESSKL